MPTRTRREPTDLEIAFGHELRRAIRARGMTQKSVAAAIGMRPYRLCDYVAGRAIPMLDRAVRLADVLMCPRLIEMAQAVAMRVCELCGAEYLDAGQQRKSKWCSQSCRMTNASRKKRGTGVVNERIARKRVMKYAAAVAAFCGDCTAGEGLCRDDECHLRPVSPVPFIPLAGLKKGAA